MRLHHPIQQRTLHGPRATRITPRAANTVEHRARLAARLTPRDRWIVRMVHEHRVLTTEQIQAMAFSSDKVARRRLVMLFRASVLDRFQPYLAAGRRPEHYILGPTGASLLAGELGIELREFGYHRERVNGIVSSPRLAHLVALNDWFATLVATARHRPGVRVEEWWSEARCAQNFGDLVRPDAWGRYREADRAVEFFLEFDMGTETLARLAAKLPGYANLAAATAITTPLLLWLPTQRRETSARARLQTALQGLDQPSAVPLATAAADLLNPEDPFAGPADPVWLPLHPDRVATGRVTLADLTDTWPYLPPAIRHDDAAAPAASSHLDIAGTTTGARRRRPMPPTPPMPPL